jgi:sugar transferase (PEP-CTERM system associated)
MISVFGHSVRAEMLALYLVEALACFLVVYLVLAFGAGAAMPVENGSLFGFAALLALCSGPISGAGGLYQPQAWRETRRMLAGLLVVGVLLAPLVLLAFALFRADLPVAQGWHPLLAIVLAAALTVALVRLAFVGAARAGLFTRRVAVLRRGAEPMALEAAAAATPRRNAFEIVTAIDGGAAAELAPEALRARGVRLLVLEAGAALPVAQQQALAAAGIRVVGETDFAERTAGRTDLARLAPGWLATANGAREGAVENVLRRGFDITLALAMLIAALPLLLVTALAIRLDSPGPIFYRQERVGRGGRPFHLVKFRSMVVDAEAGGAPRWATKHDPRVTAIGRFLRLTRIDELPQLLNVLRGDMAFVGPRPERPAFVEQLARAIPHYNDRAVVKPGITGWAQVNYPYGASVEDARQKLTYDLYYVRRRSLFLDLLILVATVRVVLFQEGSR